MCKDCSCDQDERSRAPAEEKKTTALATCSKTWQKNFSRNRAPFRRLGAFWSWRFFYSPLLIFCVCICMAKSPKRGVALRFAEGFCWELRACDEGMGNMIMRSMKKWNGKEKYGYGYECGCGWHGPCAQRERYGKGREGKMDDTKKKQISFWLPLL